MEQKLIEDILRNNTLDYSAYVLLNRAIPSLYDGLKPVYRRILYTMFKEKAFKFTKSATMSGKVMKYHPHGDCYPTMVGLAQKDSHIVPYLVGKGNFGQHTSKDLMYGSSRYTEVKLSDFAKDIMKDLNNHAIKFIPNYDNTDVLPELLPVKFPNILLFSQSGIGVGMASDIPSFNMKEIYEGIEEYIKNNKKTLLVPDFATGGEVLYNKNELEKINYRGIGCIKIRGKYTVEGNKIRITQIPYTTDRETIIDKIVELRDTKFKEILKITDTTNLKGMSITIQIKNNTNIDLLMSKLFKLTKLEDSYNANMNILVDGLPKVVGVWECIDKWLEWRINCIKNATEYEISKFKNSLHLAYGVKEIIDYIPDVIEIIRFESENNIIEKLCNKFNIDDKQAEYISEMKLKRLNEDNLNKIIKEIDNIESKISEKENYLVHKSDILNTILDEMKEIVKKYGQPRRTEIITNIEDLSEKDMIEDYNCRILYTENYIKKHLKQSNNHKIKDGEIILGDITSNNKYTVLIFTNKNNRYKIDVNDLDTITPNSLGQHLPSLCKFEENEKVIKIISYGIENDDNNVLAIFKNGNIAKVPVQSFISRSNKLTNCFNENLIDLFMIKDNIDLLCINNQGKAVIINTNQINIKKSKSTKGNTFMKMDEGIYLAGAIPVNNDSKFKIKTNKTELEFELNKLEDSRSLFEYLQGNKGNKGKFIYNCKAKNDEVNEVQIM